MATSPTYRWATSGDVNAFFGLMLDNVANLVLTVGLLVSVFHFPASFALRYMIPGTALGVLVGDLLFTWMAFNLARKSGRNDITAMPLGLDTPSTFGMVFFVLGPAFLAAEKAGLSTNDAARQAWQIGICAIVASGLFKLACSLGAGWIRRQIPRAGLLGSLAAIALVLISFLPLLDILHYPLVGLISLAIILTTLTARIPLPGRTPGALGALLVGALIYYLMRALGMVESEGIPFDVHAGLLPYEWMEAWKLGWLEAIPRSMHYLPIVIPFALATVVGGIDCTESAAAVGDEYHTGRIIAVEGFATLVAGISGGVIQTTPYIGHPAYKAMGGRSAYTLATAIFVGTAGMIGYFGYMYAAIPKAAIFPMLVFVGLEISAQSFHATPHRHYPAVALACVPALANLVMLYADQILGAAGSSIAALEANPAFALLARQLQTMRMLASGFVLTSLLWASMLAALIDHRLRRAAAYMLIGAACSLFGLIHSPLATSPLSVPWQVAADLPRAASSQSPWFMAGAYASTAGLLFAWSFWFASHPANAAALASPQDPPHETTGGSAP